MQVHETAQAAPGLAWREIKNTGICMQNHAPCECMTFFGKNGGIFRFFLTGYCAVNSARRRA